RLVAVPASRPADHAVAALWQWGRDAVTATPCVGTAATVTAAVPAVRAGLAPPAEDGTRRWRSERQTAAVAETARHPERRGRRPEPRRHRTVRPILTM